MDYLAARPYSNPTALDFGKNSSHVSETEEIDSSSSSKEDCDSSLEHALSHWRHILEDVDPCEFPVLDAGTVDAQGFGDIEIKSICRGGDGILQKHGIFVDELISAAWNVTLSRYTASDRVCSGFFRIGLDRVEVSVQSMDMSSRESVLQFIERSREERTMRCCFGPWAGEQLQETSYPESKCAFDTAIVSQADGIFSGIGDVCKSIQEKFKIQLSVVILSASMGEEVKLSLAYCKSKMGVVQAERLALSFCEAIDIMMRNLDAPVMDFEKTISQGGVEKPTPEVEAMLKSVWAEALQIDVGSINSTDDFMLLGGDSISSMKLVATLRGRGWSTTVLDVYRSSKFCDMTHAISETSTQSEKVLARFVLIAAEDKNQLQMEASEACQMPLEAVQDIYPCSPLQEGFLALGSAQDGAYVGQDIITLSADVDVDRYQKAWETLMERESILRTRFIQTDNHGVMQVVVDEKLQWKYADDLDNAVRDDRSMPMTLGSPLIRHTLVRTGAMDCVHHICTIHHALYDGWSLKVLKNELYKLYCKPVAYPSCPSFNKFIEYLLVTDWSQSRTFWKNYLEHSLPLSFPPPAKASPRGIAKRTILLSSSAKPDLPLPNMLQAAWALIIGRYAETEDVIFGTTLTGRTAPVSGIQQMSGPTITTIPIRVRLNDKADKTLKMLIQDVSAAFVATLPHQHMGLQAIRGVSQAATEACNFHALLVVQPPLDESLQQNPFLQRNTQIDLAGLHTYSLLLSANLEDGDASIKITASFDEQVIDGRDVNRLLGQLDSVLQKMNREADCPLSDLELLSLQDEKDIAIWNHEYPEPVDSCIHERFQERVLLHPNAAAICSVEGEVTYAELDHLSSKLAWRLVELGVEAEHIVPLAFEKSTWTIVAMIAVLKAGGAFVLLDTAHPQERLEYISSKVRATVLLSSRYCAAKVSSFVSFERCIIVDADSLSTFPDIFGPPLVRVSPHNAAYVMFTSGSTGMPKGCILTHGANCTAALYHGAAMGMHKGSRSMQFSSYTFAACIIEILTTLSFGGCVCVMTEDERMNDIAGAIQRYRINWSFLTPSLLSVLDPDMCPTLTDLSVGGESIRLAQIDAWADRVRLGHGYGNAECCGVVSTTLMKRGESTVKDVGRGVSGLCWIVEPSNHNRLAPVGAVGELIIEGAIVGRGYIDEPQKTAAVFITAPTWRTRFGVIPQNHRFYKTGDLARYASHGEGRLQYCGRKDTQIKLHGQRIELGEVDYHVKRALPVGMDCVAELIVPKGGSKENAVIVAFLAGKIFQKQEGKEQAKEAEKGDQLLSMSLQTKRLAASIVEKVKAALSRSLPAFMAPTVYIPLSEFPMTVSGKVYRKGLRELGSQYNRSQLTSLLRSTETVTSATKSITQSTLSSAEKTLAKTWARVLPGNLQVDEMNPDDHFFRLGGDSLKAMALVSSLRKCKSGMSITAADVFRSPQLREMALSCTQNNQKSQKEPMVGKDPPPFTLLGSAKEEIRAEMAQQLHVAKDMIEDISPCSPSQEDFMYATARRPGCFRVNVVVELPTVTDTFRFRASVDKTLAENPILRAMIMPTSLGLVHLSLKKPMAWNFADHLASYLEADKNMQMGFGDCLSRIAIITETSGCSYFVWTVHHALYDSWSIPLVIQALSANYDNGSSPKRPSFNRYIDCLRSKDQRSMRNFWTARLAEVAPVRYPLLPSDSYDPNATMKCLRRLKIPTSISDSSVTTPNLIRAAWALVLSAYSGTRDVVFGAVEHGRNEDIEGIEEILGPTVQVVPIRVLLDFTQSISDFLEQVQLEATEMYPFQSIGMRGLRSLGAEGVAACGFTNILLVQMADGPETSAANECPTSFKWSFASADLGDFHHYPIVAKAHLSRDDHTVLFELVYDAVCLDSSQAECMLGQVENVIVQLCAAQQKTLVGDVKVSVLEKLSNLSKRAVDIAKAACNVEEMEKVIPSCLSEKADVAVAAVSPHENEGSAQTHAIFIALGTHHSEADPQEVLNAVNKDYLKRVVGSDFKRKFAAAIPGVKPPSLYIPISSIPRTPNGSIDRVALNVHASKILDVRARDQHFTEKERPFIAIWAEVLKIQPNQVTKDQSFFDAGGDSVKAMQLVMQLRSVRLGLAVKDIYQHPTLRELASRCTDLQPDTQTSLGTHEPFSSLTGVDDVEKFLREDVLPHLTVGREAVEDVLECPFFQKEMFGAGLLKNRGLMYYIDLEFHGYVDATRLERAVADLVHRHSMLRTAFVPRYRDLLQVIVRPGYHEFAHKVLSTGEDIGEVVKQIAIKDRLRTDIVGRPIPLFQFIHNPGGNSRLLISRFSHAQFDGFSISLMLHDLQTLYHGPIPGKTTQFSDYLYARKMIPQREQWAYWSELLQGSTMTALVANPYPTFQNYTESHVAREIPVQWWRSIEASSPDILMAAWATVLGQFSGTTDVLFGNTSMNRSIHVPGGIEKVLGPCVNTIPVRIRLLGPHMDNMREQKAPLFTVRDLLDAVTQQRIQTLPYESTSLDDIVAKCPHAWVPRIARYGSTIVWQDFDSIHRTMSSTAHQGEAKVTNDEDQEKEAAHEVVLNPFAASLGMDFAGTQCIATLDDPKWDPTDLAVVARQTQDGERVRFEFHFSQKNLEASLVEAMGDSLAATIQGFAECIDRPVSDLLAPLTKGSNTPRIPIPQMHPPPSRGNASYQADGELRNLVQRCWVEAFGWEDGLQMGLNKDIFQNGGSVVIASTMANLYRSKGIDVEVEDVLDHPTVEAQIALLEHLRLPKAGT